MGFKRLENIVKVLGDSKLKQDAKCPFCGKIKEKGSHIEVVQLPDGKQYASFHCKGCYENVVIR